MILDKDPFGYDYMMYSIRHKCEEVDELDYEDGLRFYYFYTGGNKGGNEEIKTMLCYLRDSREENATDAATKEIHRFTEKVKIHPEVRKSYMLWEEYEYLLMKKLRPEVKEEVREEVKKEVREEIEEEVKEEIKIEQKAESILELLEDYGEIPEDLKKRVVGEKNIEILRRWHKLAAKAKSMEEFEQMM